MPEPYALDLAAVRAFCDRNGVPYVTNDELGQIAIPRPDRPAWAVRIVPRPERGMLTVAYPLPGRIPADRVPALQAAAGLLNARTFMGAWVLNTDSGELYFRYTMLTDHVLYDDESLRLTIQVVIGSVERMVKRLDRVLKGEDASVVLQDDPPGNA